MVLNLTVKELEVIRDGLLNTDVLALRDPDGFYVIKDLIRRIDILINGGIDEGTTIRQITDQAVNNFCDLMNRREESIKGDNYD